jgi:hypothetical protein
MVVEARRRADGPVLAGRHPCGRRASGTRPGGSRLTSVLAGRAREAFPQGAPRPNRRAIRGMASRYESVATIVRAPEWEGRAISEHLCPNCQQPLPHTEVAVVDVEAAVDADRLTPEDVFKRTYLGHGRQSSVFVFQGHEGPSGATSTSPTTRSATSWRGAGPSPWASRPDRSNPATCGSSRPTRRTRRVRRPLPGPVHLLADR